MSCLLYLITYFILLNNVNYTPVMANDVLGCGGYIKSEVDINYSEVSLKLLTIHGNQKYETECAPNNGYYFIPLYDKGEYILKVFPPSGWTFEPNEVILKVDGSTDPCSLSQDINFHFKGFAVVGKVISVGSDEGPAGVTVSLRDGNKQVMSTLTTDGGNYVFTPLASGKYQVEASHPTWTLIENKVTVSVEDQNGDAGSSLIVGGYSLSGNVANNGKVLDKIFFVLHSTVRATHKLGCSLGIPKGYVTKLHGFVLCYTTSDDNGAFKFSGISPGSYELVPYSQSDEMKYEIAPPIMKIHMTHSDFIVKQEFQVEGCPMIGNVYMGKNMKGIEGAKVILNQNLETLTDEKGEFHFDAIKFGRHKLQVLAEGVSFNVFEATLGLGMINKFQIFPYKFKTCFSISVDSTTEANRQWIINLMDTKKSKMQIGTDATGYGCQLLEPGKYSASVALSDSDDEAGIRFGPEEHIFEVGSDPMKIMSFSQFLGEIVGSIDCLESCKLLTVSLRPLLINNGAPRTITSNHGKFSFKEIVPGDYQMTIDKEEWCWKERTVSVSVNAKKVNARFEQTGFRLTLNASHRTTLNYLTNGGLKGSISVTEGTSRECVSSPGKYSFKPAGCHKYAYSVFTWDTSTPQLLSLTATHHRVSGSLISLEAGPFSIEAKNTASGQEISLGPLVESSVKNVYNFEHWLTQGDIVTFTPKSPSNLFQYSPATYELKMENDCVTSFVKFEAERALFVKGSIKPAIKGVHVKVLDPQSGETYQYTTNSDGNFIAGPLDKSLDYVVTVEKLGYTISPSSQAIKSGSASEVLKISFEAYKLAEINVKIIDEASKEPLSGVLVSTSGGKDYRQNSLTEADGTIAFLALMPADYFIRPMMKEYIFNPVSKMVNVEGGATVAIQISGTRIAYSIFGQIHSLSGEPEGDVVIEAIGSGAACLGMQEEALADSKGQFRIRGLKPMCDYKIALKKGEGINKHMDRALPEEKMITMDQADYLGLKVLVLRPFLQMDVSIFVHTELQYLPSLSAEIFRDQVSEGPLQVVPVGTHQFFMLPPMTRDNLDYTVRLKTSLPRSQYSFSLQSVSFKANSSFVRLEMSFKPTLKSIEAEISRGTVMAFIVFVVVVIITLNYNKLEPIVTQGINMYISSTKKQTFKMSMEAFGNDSIARKRTKVRKT